MGVALVEGAPTLMRVSYCNVMVVTIHNVLIIASITMCFTGLEEALAAQGFRMSG